MSTNLRPCPRMVNLRRGTLLVCAENIILAMIPQSKQYPAPGGSLSSWSTSYSKAAQLVGKMSLAEKVNITTGTGWAMGLCVGNTGKPLLFFTMPCAHLNPQAPPTMLVFLLCVFKMAHWESASRTRSQHFLRDLRLGQLGIASSCNNGWSYLFHPFISSSSL